MRRSPHAFSTSLALAASLLSAGTAFAQTTDPSAGAGSASSSTGASGTGSTATGGSATAGTGGTGANGATVTTVTPPSVTFPTYPGGVAPTPNGSVLGGGNTQGSSSSKPITGNEEDGFDLGKSSSAGGSVHGQQNGNIIFNGGGGGGMRGEGVRGIGPTVVPRTHLVKKGDTLWDICDYYFHNPYEWPRIWALNPALKNPHWIEPGQSVLLRKDGTVATTGNNGGGRLGLRGKLDDPKTIYLQDESFIEEGKDFDFGTIEGAREERTFLANNDEVYLRWSKKEHEVQPGAEYSIFRDLKKTKHGTIVELQGGVTIDTVDAKNKVARGHLTGSIVEIERGAHFGPVPRRFDAVAPVANEIDGKEGVLFAAFKPGELHGQHQVVFLDQGEGSGIKPGNTFEVVRRGDGLQRTLPSRSSVLRIETGGDRRDLERIPEPENQSVLKDEVVGTIRVLAVGKKTATCYVVESVSELEAGERVILRKGH